MQKTKTHFRQIPLKDIEPLVRRAATKRRGRGINLEYATRKTEPYSVREYVADSRGDRR
jgi:hypothetical protein